MRRRRREAQRLDGEPLPHEAVGGKAPFIAQEGRQQRAQRVGKGRRVKPLRPQGAYQGCVMGQRFRQHIRREARHTGFQIIGHFDAQQRHADAVGRQQVPGVGIPGGGKQQVFRRQKRMTAFAGQFFRLVEQRLQLRIHHDCFPSLVLSFSPCSLRKMVLRLT